MLVSCLKGKLFSPPTHKTRYVVYVSEDFIVVLVTAKDHTEAEKISQTLLEMRIIACANIVNEIASRFVWQGKIESASECLVLMKTRRILFGQVAQKVKELHSYEVPEIIALPIIAASVDYLSWLADNLP